MTLLTYNSKYIVPSATVVTTTSSTLADDTPATQTFSLTSTKTVLIIYTANSAYLSTNGVGGIKNAINVDGTDVSLMNDSGYAANHALRNTCIWVGSLDSGSHTITGRLASAVNAQTTTVNNRTLLIYVFNGDEFIYIDDPTAQIATSTTYIDDSVATTTFTPSGDCKALAFYAITNLKGSTERYTGKKICINIDDVDQYGEAAKSSNSAATSPDSLATVYAQALTAVSTKIKGRLSTNTGTQTVTANRHVLGVLLLDPSVILDLRASVTSVSSTATTLANDEQAHIARTRSTTSELLILGQATKLSGTTGSMYGLAYGLNFDGADVALSRSSPAYTSDAESSFVAFASTEEAGAHTIDGRFAANAGTSAAVVSTRVLIALWFPNVTLIQTTTSISGGGSVTASISTRKRINSTVGGGGSQTSNLIANDVNYSHSIAITTYHNAQGTDSANGLGADSTGYWIFSGGYATRFTQTGIIKRIRFYAANVSALAVFKIVLWSRNEQTGGYANIYVSTDLKTSIVQGYNDIDISAQNISVTEGTCFGLYLTSTGASTAFLATSSSGSGEFGETRYCRAASYTDMDWHSQTEFGAAQTIDIDFMMDSPDVVFIGGSILSGYPLSNAYTDQPGFGGFDNTTSIPYKFRTLSGLTYQNMGINANRYPDLNTRFSKDVIEKHPTYVVIEGGVDDLRWGTSDTSTIIYDTELQITASQAAGIFPVVLLILPAYGNYLTAAQSLQADVINNAIIAYHTENPDFVIVDAREALGSHNAQTGWALDSQYSSDSDNVHLNAAGNTIVAQKIYDSSQVTTKYLSSSISGGGSKTSNIREYNYINSTMTGGGSLTAALFRFVRLVSSITGGGVLTADIRLPIYNLRIKTNDGYILKASDGAFLYSSDTSPGLDLSSAINGGGSQTASIIEFKRFVSSISGGGSETSNIIKYNYISSNILGVGSETSNIMKYNYITSSVMSGGSETASLSTNKTITSSISGVGSETSNPITYELIRSVLTAAGELTADVQLNTGSLSLYSVRTGGGSKIANMIEFENTTATITGVGLQNAALSSNQNITASLSGGGTSAADIIKYNYISSNISGAGSETSNIIEYNYITSSVMSGGSETASLSTNKIIASSIAGVGSETSNIRECNYITSSVMGSGSETAALSTNKITASSVSGGGSETSNVIKYYYSSSNISGSGTSAANIIEYKYILSVMSGSGSAQAAISINKKIYSFVSGSGSRIANNKVFGVLNSTVIGIGQSTSRLTYIYYGILHFKYSQTLIINQNIRNVTIFQNGRTASIENDFI